MGGITSISCISNCYKNNLEAKSEVNYSKQQSTNKNIIEQQEDSSIIRNRKSLYFSNENFVYLKRKDILIDYEFTNRVGQGNLRIFNIINFNQRFLWYCV